MIKNIKRYSIKHSMQEVSDMGVYPVPDEYGAYVMYSDVEFIVEQHNNEFYNHPAYIGYADSTDMKDDDRQEKWEQQFNQYGFDETICWGFDHNIIQWIIPRLRMFNKISKNVFVRNNMHNDLDKVLEVFEKYYGNESNNDLMGMEETEEFNEAWDLFTKHFHRLWI